MTMHTEKRIPLKVVRDAVRLADAMRSTRDGGTNGLDSIQARRGGWLIFVTWSSPHGSDISFLEDEMCV